MKKAVAANSSEDVLQKKQKFNRMDESDLSNVKIKTLSEIRAEKAKRKYKEEDEITSTNSEVTSTSNLDSFNTTANKTHSVAKVPPTKRLKKGNPQSDTSERRPKLIRRHHSNNTAETSANELADKPQLGSDYISQSDHTSNNDDKMEGDNLTDSKLDEVLLLEDEDLEENVTLKAEEDILKDIDELLNE